MGGTDEGKARESPFHHDKYDTVTEAFGST